MKGKSLVGERFGSLVVVEPAGSSSAGNLLWMCRCDCGNATRSAGSDLRRGRSKTCGCGSQAATRRRHAETRDLIGKTFGRLKVTAFAGVNSYPRATWRCVCTCGVEVVVAQHHLEGGSNVSCGRCRCRDPRPVALRDDITYGSAHQRVKRLHGLPSTHDCIDCGGPASDWSYDHQDIDERRDGRGRAYSLKPEHYRPRCRSCHKVFDLAAIRAAGEVATEGVTA